MDSVALNDELRDVFGDVLARLQRYAADAMNKAALAAAPMPLQVKQSFVAASTIVGYAPVSFAMSMPAPLPMAALSNPYSKKHQYQQQSRPPFPHHPPPTNAYSAPVLPALAPPSTAAMVIANHHQQLQQQRQQQQEQQRPLAAHPVRSPLAEKQSQQPNGAQLPQTPVSAVVNEMSAMTKPTNLMYVDKYLEVYRPILLRLNAYDYESHDGFFRELMRAMDQLALTPPQRKELQDLIAKASRSFPKAPVSTKPAPTDQTKSAVVVPGLQQVGKSEYVVNVSVKDTVCTISKAASAQDVKQQYHQKRQHMAESSHQGVLGLYRMAKRVALDQRESEVRILSQAKNQGDKMHKSAYAQIQFTPAARFDKPVPGFTTATHSNATAPEETNDSLNVISPVNNNNKENCNSQNQPLAVEPAPLMDKPNAPVAPKRKKPSSTALIVIPPPPVRLPAPVPVPAPAPSPSPSSSSSLSGIADRVAVLRLRRVIQQQLCPHLKHQPVCVIEKPDDLTTHDWTATGRLEAGQVYSFKKKSRVSFADFVQLETSSHQSLSPCPHIFLLSTRKSIDDHLAQCDVLLQR